MSNNSLEPIVSVLQGATMAVGGILTGTAQMPSYIDPDSVKYTVQEKTDEEKATARSNIGAMSDDLDVVLSGAFADDTLTLTTKSGEEQEIPIPISSLDFDGVTSGAFADDTLTLTTKSGEEQEISIPISPAIKTYQQLPLSIALEDNTEYYIESASTLSIEFPSGNFESWLHITTISTSGTAINITLDTDAKYIGAAPEFSNGEEWEISVKNGIAICAKVGDGT